jgi:YD repeat-containing protein
MNRRDDPKTRHKAAMLLVGLAAPVAALQAGVTNYTYDELGRLVLVTDTLNGNRAFTYDPAGNRRQATVGGIGQQPSPTAPKERTPPPGSRRASVDRSPDYPGVDEISSAALAPLDDSASSHLAAPAQAALREE